MRGRARAPAAGTVLNALATGTGAAFAIEEYVRATVELDGRDGVDGAVAGEPDADTGLIERCVELVAGRYGDGRGGTVRTDSDVPMAAGLKSSSAAANAAVLATLDALGIAVEEGAGDGGTDGSGANDDAAHGADDAAHGDEGGAGGADGGDADDGATGRGGEAVARQEAARLGVEAARDAGVTVTGAFDDAAASMLGGVVVTDNDRDALLAHEPFDRDALVWIPPERAYSADADVERCRRVAPVAETAAELALSGAYGRAMTVNGFAFCAALGFPAEPLVEALPAAEGASLSGTGPGYVAVGDREALRDVRDAWRRREGRTWLTRTQNEGAAVR